MKNCEILSQINYQKSRKKIRHRRDQPLKSPRRTPKFNVARHFSRSDVLQLKVNWERRKHFELMIIHFSE